MSNKSENGKKRNLFIIKEEPYGFEISNGGAV